jgi:hypothetical protein
VCVLERRRFLDRETLDHEGESRAAEDTPEMLRQSLQMIVRGCSADEHIIYGTGASVAPLESPGHGRWVRTGRRTYDVTFLTVSADTAGNHTLTSKVRGNSG